jgi:endoglucanase
MNRRTVLQSIGSLAVGALLPEGGLARNASGGNPKLAGFNQCGYRPRSQKVFSLPPGDAPDTPFEIISEQQGHSVFAGRLGSPLLDTASGDSISFADISRFTTPGKYRLVSQGVHPQPFLIGEDVYKQALFLSMRAFYGQRCGCAVDLGDGYRYPACHQVNAFHPSSGRAGSLPSHGGWHDAGDYGRYIVNSAIACGTLLWAWELYPASLRSLSLRIPESGHKLPDYLAEVRWNMEWMLSLQDLDGGVWHKQTSEQFCGFIMPQNDKLTSYVIGTGAEPYKSTCATAGLAAVMAIAARCYNEYDESFAALCLAAAKRAWTWALAHPDVTFSNPPGIQTGAYSDTNCRDQILWASAELWRTTGDRQYEHAFLQTSSGAETQIFPPSWSDVRPLAFWAYALTQRTTDQAARNRVLERTRATALDLVRRQKSSGYGTTLDSNDYSWGSNSVAANQALLLLLAHHFEPDRQFLEAALGNLHYLLGRNCFAVSWVTHVGSNPFLHPHHRPSIADGIPTPWPGLLSGGPNAKPADKVGLTLPKLPPMRMWQDDAMAYSLNEVAINWNAPLVFLLAAANSQPL